MMKLYDFSLSGNCHKIRMLLAMLGREYERIDIDLRTRDQMAPEFVALNPLHKVPVLIDGDRVLRDSAAIMVYLVVGHGRRDLYPEDAAGMAEVQQWLSFSVNEVFNGLAMVRANVIFSRGLDPAPLEVAAGLALDMLEQRLREAEWLALGRFTLADLACYPYAALSHEGGIELARWPAVVAWCRRIEGLEGFVDMPGLTEGIRAAA
ncbi:MAG: glutathione S-transferase family protein [Pseudomonadota bacterium]